MSSSRLVGRVFGRLRHANDEADVRAVVRAELRRHETGEPVAHSRAKRRETHSFDFEASMSRANWKVFVDDLLRHGIDEETLLELDSHCLAEQSLYLLESRCERNEPVPPQLYSDFLQKARTLTSDDWQRVGILAMRLRDSPHLHDQQFFVMCCDNLHFRRVLPPGCLPQSTTSSCTASQRPITHSRKVRRVDRLEALWCAPESTVARFPPAQLLRDLTNCTVAGEVSLLQALLGEDVTVRDDVMDDVYAMVRQLTPSDANVKQGSPSEQLVLLRLACERWPVTATRVKTQNACTLALCCAANCANSGDTEMWNALCSHVDSMGDPSAVTDAFRSHPTVLSRAPKDAIHTLRLHDLVFWNSSPHVGLRMLVLLVTLGSEAFWRRTIDHCAARLDECYQADRNEGDTFGTLPEWFVQWLTVPVDSRLFVCAA